MSLFRVLMVFPDAKEETASVVSQLLKESGEITWVKSEAEARAALDSQPYHLIITDLHIPADKASLVQESEKRGLQFLQSLEKSRLQTPSLLVAVEPEGKLYQAARHLCHCEVVPEGEDFRADILKYSQETRDTLAPSQAKAPAPPQPKIANIDITIHLDRRMGSVVQGSYSIKGYGFNYRDNGELLIDYDTLLKLMEKSKELENLENWPTWQDVMGEVGTTLGEQIYQEKLRLKQSFKKSFENVLLQVGGIENLRIRFNVVRETYSLILEALTKAKEKIPLTKAEEKFLMLQAPIYRRVDICFAGEFPLFSDPETRKGPINCLIIEADASGFVKETHQDLGQLDKLRVETDWLLHYLEKLQQAALTDEEATQIGRILRLTGQEVPPEEKFSDHLKNILSKSGPWHLVHFAGHSLYHKKIVGDEIKGEGYFIFPGLKGKRPQALGASELSIEFRKASTRLLYLSSCYSGGAEFAIELANNFIPATLGFRWSVGDANALSHAKQFYHHLFQLKSVEQAFFEARREMHKEKPQERVWASPLLVMQTGD
jgi:CheY-like chemotaxis protein